MTRAERLSVRCEPSQRASPSLKDSARDCCGWCSKPLASAILARDGGHTQGRSGWLPPPRSRVHRGSWQQQRGPLAFSNFPAWVPHHKAAASLPGRAPESGRPNAWLCCNAAPLPCNPGISAGYPSANGRAGLTYEPHRSPPTFLKLTPKVWRLRVGSPSGGGPRVGQLVV